MHRALLVAGMLAIAAATGAVQSNGAIKGRVLASESGAPIAGATVTLRSADDTTVVFTTHASSAGAYRFDVPAGKYDLRATDEDRLPSFVRVAIPEAGEIEIDVVLSPQSTSLVHGRGFSGRLSRLNLSLVAQWFHGTAESLLVYREKHPVVRFGVATVR